MMKTWKNVLVKFGMAIGLFLGLMVFDSYVFATMTLTSASGVSAFSIGATPGDVKIFGGMIVNNAQTTCTNAATQTCNTCDGTCSGAQSLCACNPVGITPLGTPSLVFTSTLDLSNRTFKLKGSSGSEETQTVSISGNTVKLEGNTWAHLCTMINNDCSAGITASTSFSGTLTLTVSKQGSSEEETTEKVTIQLMVDIVDQGEAYVSECPNGQGTIAGQGICSYKIYPGDSKVYFDDVKGASNFPATTSVTDIKFTSLVFFFEEGTGNIGNIKNNSNTFEVSIDGNGEFDKRVKGSGILNDHEYCFALGHKNTAGNIRYFEDPTVAGAARICATPSLVEGLLADKKCFIATAAYGSPLHPFVEMLRTFRATFLAPYDWGQKFIKFYYEHSPKLAREIDHSPTLKAMTQVILWPVVGFAALSLKLGLGPALALVIGLFFSLTGLVYMRRNRKA